MELLHVGSDLVGSVDRQLKFLEEKFETGRPAEIMKDIYKIEDRLRHCSEIEMEINKTSKAVKDLDETVNALDEKLKSKHTDVTNEIKRVEVKINDKCTELSTKINDINNRVVDIEKKINTAINALNLEAKKPSFLSRLLWLD